MNPNEPPGRLDRIASIFSRGWPGLLVLIWTMLSHASTARFAARVFGDATAYLDKHSWVGVLVGSTFIAIAVIWPDLKKYLPKMPKTQQEKLDALSERVDAEVVRQNELLGSLQDSLNLFDRGNELRDRRIDRMDDSLTTYITRTVELETRNKQMVDALGDLPRFQIRLTEFAKILHGADLAVEMFTQLRKRHPNTPVSDMPFSSWRPSSQNTAPQTPDIVDGEQWARFLETHWRWVRVFASQTGYLQLCSGELDVFVARWNNANNSVTGEEVSRLLQEHRDRIQSFREEYVELFKRKHVGHPGQKRMNSRLLIGPPSKT